MDEGLLFGHLDKPLSQIRVIFLEFFIEKSLETKGIHTCHDQIGLSTVFADQILAVFQVLVNLSKLALKSGNKLSKLMLSNLMNLSKNNRKNLNRALAQFFSTIEPNLDRLRIQTPLSILFALVFDHFK